MTGCTTISAFFSLVVIPVAITSSPTELKVCAVIAWIKKCKSIIKKKQEKHDQIVLLAKSELNSIEVSISNALIDSVISHGEFVLRNNVLK